MAEPVTEPSDHTEPSGYTALPGARHHFSRRALLRNGSIGAAAAGLAAAVPGLSGLLGGAAAVAPEVPAAAGEGSAVAGEASALEGSAVEGPIVAHITDAAAGRVSVYVGEREVLLQDRTLVQHLLRAAR